MPRAARRDIIVPGGIYHVYARGNDRMPLFRDHDDYKFYLDALNELRAPHGVLLYHYALMPNHVHLLVCPTSGDLSTFMKTLQIRFAKLFCRKYRFMGHVWQGRFKSKVVNNDAYLLACGNYIEMNPVRAGLVTDPADWPYSSYRAYGYGHRDDLVTIDPLYANLGPSPTDRQATYRRLVLQTSSLTSVPLVSGT